MTNVSIAQEPEPSSLRLILTLGIAGFFSGLTLVTIYLWTLPVIEANKAAALREAVFQVLPGCASFQTLVLQEDRLVLQTEDPSQQIDAGTEKIFVGYDQAGTLIGFAIPGGEPGFQDTIQGILGYNPYQKLIIGFEVLESKETPGLGDKIIKDERFRLHLSALAVEPEIVAVKPGTKQAPHEIETITGATISSKAVIRLLQKAIRRWQPFLERYVSQIEKPTQDNR